MDERFERDLMRGSLDLMVLSVLAEGWTYGYRVQQRVREASDGRVRLAAGTLYPLLHKLEAERAVRSRWEKGEGRKRKWYTLTASGRRRLQRQAGQWEQLHRCISNLLRPAMRELAAN